MENRRVFSESQVPVLRTLPSTMFANQGNLLSARQLAELNASVLQYLKPVLKSHPEVLDIVKEELDKTTAKSTGKAHTFSSLITTEIPEDYLQKKWSTVLRLQRNIQDLETKNKALETRNDELVKTIEQLQSSSNTSTQLTTVSKMNWIPSMVKTTLRFHNSPITAIAIHPFNPYLITASQDGMLVIWNMLDFAEPVNHIKNAHFKSINKLIFQKDSSMLISCSSDQIIKVWDLSQNIETMKTPMKIFTGHEHIVSSLCLSHENPNILFSSSRDKSIKVWDLETGWTLHTINAHSDWVRAIDTIGDYLISGSADTSIRITHWPSQTGIGLCLGHQQVIEDVIFLPELSNQYLDLLDDTPSSTNEAAEYAKVKYKYAASCGRDKLIKIWKLPLPGFNPINGQPMANSLNLHGKLIKEIRGHQSWVRKLQCHYNGKFLISCSDDQTIKIWDLENLTAEPLEPVRTLSNHQSFVNTIALATTPESELNDDSIRCYLASGGADNQINVWV